MRTTTYNPLKNNFSSDSKKNIVLVAVLLTAFFTSCSQDGADGSVGATGVQGETGAQGTTGTANVIYSDWVPTGTLTLGTPDIFGSVSGGVYFTILASKLTQEILDKGTVLVYWLNASSDGVRSLPYIADYSDGSHLNIKGISKLQQIIIYANFSDGTPAVSMLKNNNKWRYILVPGGVVTTGKEAKLEYSKMSYEDICAHFNIQP